MSTSAAAAVGAVFLGADALAARLQHDPERKLQFRPVLRDTFQVGNATLQLQRDKAGKVIAVDYSNPVLRNVRLTRLDER